MKPSHNKSIGSAICLMVMGMVALAAWAWSTHAAPTQAIRDRLTGSDFAVIAVFLLVGLVAANCLENVAEAVVNVIMSLLRIALLLVAIGGGIVLWRNYRDGNREREAVVEAQQPDAADEVNQPDEAGGPAAAPPAVSVPASSNPDLRRRELEAELQRIDEQSGKAWWRN